MDENIKIEKWTLEDGRRAERRVVETTDSNGQSEKVIELHVEDLRPIRLQQRVIETTKPMLVERKLETIDPMTGNVIEQKIESLEPKSPMQVVQHIATPAVVAQTKLDADKPVTKQEMIDAIVAAIKTNRECSIANHANKKTEPKKVQSLGLAEEFENMNVAQKDNMSTTDKIMLVIIAVQFLGLGYILFFM
jgi:hypothetical protein